MVIPLWMVAGQTVDRQPCICDTAGQYIHAGTVCDAAEKRPILVG